MIFVGSLTLLGCARPTNEPTLTKFVEKEIRIVSRPDPLLLRNLDFFVVSDKNLDEFLDKLRTKEGAVVFVALSVEDYENLSLNMAEFERYIRQQQSIIVYYEDSVK